MSALQIRRGLKAALPASAALGEPLITTDTRELFVGTGSSIYKIGDIVFAATAPEVVEGKVWINTTDNSIHRASDDFLTWEAIGGSTSAGSVTEDFQVYGVTQGTYSDGNTIAAGTSLEEVVKNMLQAVIPASYQAPTLGLNGSAPTTVEAGTTLTPTITPSWLQRDGGAPILYTLKKNGGDVQSNASAIPYTDGAFVLGDTTVNYQANETYNGGPVKLNNQGNPSPAGQIGAGTATSNTLIYTGKRNLFYGFDTGTIAPADSAAVRILTTKQLGPVNGTSFTLNIPAGTKRIVFAYPATLRDVSNVKYVELGNGEVKDTFELTTFDVEGAAGFTAIAYKIYSYVPAVPFGDAVTYVVTI